MLARGEPAVKVLSDRDDRGGHHQQYLIANATGHQRLW
jgi:hypothetical protein